MLSQSTVELIEQYILEGWEDGLTGQTLMNYVCAMSNQPQFNVEPVLNDMIKRMSE